MFIFCSRYNPILLCLFIFLHKFFQLWPSRALLVDSCVPMTYPIRVCVWARTCAYVCVCIFGALSDFPALQEAPDSSYIFLASVLESAVSPGSLGFFYWRILEIKKWVLRNLLFIGKLLIPVREQRNTRVYINSCIFP